MVQSLKTNRPTQETINKYTETPKHEILEIPGVWLRYLEIKILLLRQTQIKSACILVKVADK